MEVVVMVWSTVTVVISSSPGRTVPGRVAAEVVLLAKPPPMVELEEMAPPVVSGIPVPMGRPPVPVPVRVKDGTVSMGGGRLPTDEGMGRALVVRAVVVGGESVTVASAEVTVTVKVLVMVSSDEEEEDSDAPKASLHMHWSAPT